jgi:hypothetical protein
MSDGMSSWSLGRHLQVALYDHESQTKMHHSTRSLLNWCSENLEMPVLYKYAENGPKLCVVSPSRGALVLHEACEPLADFQYGQKHS